MIGVVGDGTDAVAAAIDDGGEHVRTGPPGRVLAADPDAVVAVGPPALSELVRDRGVSDAPILAVDAGGAFPDVGDPADAVADFRAGRLGTVPYPVFGVTVGDRHVGNAVFDAMVVTTDPARISEFRIASGGKLGSIRADGVVVATPAGSHGYARSAGGPRLRPGSGAAAVVPVAAFTMSPDRWVVGLDDPVEITNERDVPVSVLLDDERTDPDADCAVSVAATGAIDVVSPDAG